MKYLNGYKTYLGMIGLGLLYAAGKMFPEFQDAAFFGVIDYFLKAWTGVAVVHKVDKAIR